jgi:hypothetical protein
VLTANEVDHHRRDADRAVLFVVSQIGLRKQGEEWIADGGHVQVTSPWDVDTGLLEPKDFYWSAPMPPFDGEVR